MGKKQPNKRENIRNVTYFIPLSIRRTQTYALSMLIMKPTHNSDVEGADAAHDDDGGPGGEVRDGGEGEGGRVQADPQVEARRHDLAG